MPEQNHVHSRLKQATAQAHEDTEELAYIEQLRNGTITLAQYKHLIAANYQLFCHYEPLIASALPSTILEQLHWPEREKLAALKKEVQQWELPTSVNLPTRFTLTKAQAFGALYVLEGSTLGGNMIAKMIDKAGIIPTGKPMLFYGFYGDRTGIKWKQLLQILDEQLVDEQEQEAAVAMAKHVFATLSELLKQVRE